MKGKTVEVAPFDSYTYYVTNRYDKTKHGPFESVVEARDYTKKNFARGYYYGSLFSDTFNLTKGERDQWLLERIMKRSAHNMRYPFVMTNQFGDIVTPYEISWAGERKVYRPSWIERDAKRIVIERGLLKFKDDGKKIKTEWSYREDYDQYGCKMDYTNDAYRHYRRIGTHNERKWNEACNSEYGEGLVRRKRCGRNLPTSWDEAPSGMWGLKKSWKHNSKRRKQWKAK